MNYPKEIYVDIDLVGQEEPKSGWQKYQRVDKVSQDIVEQLDRTHIALLNKDGGCDWLRSPDGVYSTSCGHKSATNCGAFCGFCGRHIEVKI